MKITAFIPARAGSTRLPNKNVRELGGKPLIAWTLEACDQADDIDEIIFSTDSDEYWEIAQRYVSNKPLYRDIRTPYEASSKVKIFDYLKFNISKIFGNSREHILLALPTMPFRDSADVNSAIKVYRNVCQPVFSAVEYEAPVTFAFSKAQNGWQPLFPDSPMITGNTRSQEQPSYYHPNGAMYLFSLEKLEHPGTNTFYDDALPFIMDPGKSVDIDTEYDFILADTLMHLIKRTT